MDKKVFVIFNTSNIGDVLVTNTLVQNIKYYYPDSYIVFICNTPILDVAKYQDGVDDVIAYDKKKCRKIKDIWKFASKFPYKKPFCSMVSYSNERNLLISKLIGSKHILSNHKFKFWNTKEKYKIKEYPHMKDRWAGLIEPLTGEHKNLPIKYVPPEFNSPILERLKNLKRPVPISTTGNFAPKDMPVEDCAELIRLLNNDGFTPVMVGAGDIARKFVTNLKKMGCFEFEDLVDCTSFVELAHVLKICRCCISIDTGTLHFANALQVPVVGVFYNGLVYMWGSDSELYPSIMLEGRDVKPQDIMSAFKRLIGVCV